MLIIIFWKLCAVTKNYFDDCNLPKALSLLASSMSDDIDRRNLSKLCSFRMYYDTGKVWKKSLSSTCRKRKYV